MKRGQRHDAQVLDVTRVIENDLFVKRGVHDPSWLEVAQAYYGRRTISGFELANIMHVSDRVMDQLRQDDYVVLLVNQTYYSKYRRFPNLIMVASDPERPEEDQQREHARSCLTIGKLRHGLLWINNDSDMPQLLIWDEWSRFQHSQVEGKRAANGARIALAVEQEIISLREGYAIMPPPNGHPLDEVGKPKPIEIETEERKAIEAGKEG